jgi:hypothetical protein
MAMKRPLETNNNGPSVVAPFEIEEEDISLLDNVDPRNGSVIHHLRFRKTKDPFVVFNPRRKQKDNQHGMFRMQIRGVCRNVLALSALAWLVVVFLGIMDSVVIYVDDHLPATSDRPPHQGSFGGRHQPLPNWKDEDLPLSNAGQAVPSISVENLDKQIGDYLHDPYLSPFASFIYYQPKESEIDHEQQAYLAKMEATKKKWGAWEAPTDVFYEKYSIRRPQPPFHTYPYRDVPLKKFPEHSWQFDETYVTSFLQQAKGLLHRVKEGVYTEYGHPTIRKDGKKISKNEMDKRGELFRVITEDFFVKKGAAVEIGNVHIAKKGVAYMSETAWDGLVQKLLHAMMTNDVFYVVLVGQGSTYKANNLFQSQIMQFNYLMEPVFDLLGMTLVTRNMGMNASTTNSALGGADVYGESDILWYYRSNGEKETIGQHDLLQKQAILAGERVPLILTPTPVGLEADTNGTALLGNIQPGAEVCSWTKHFVDGTLKHPKSIPACQHVRCDDTLLAEGYCSVHDSVCWVDRKDWDPTKSQNSDVGSQDESYPGVNAHQWEGRKLSLVLLHALDAAIERWQDAILEDGFPLQEKYWHVRPMYEEIRKNVRSLGIDSQTTACELFLSKLDPMICHLAMHSHSEWTPQVRPQHFQLRNIATGLQDMHQGVELYRGVDLLPWKWKIPYSHIDVHMIAIATNKPPHLVDGNFDDYDDDYSWLCDEDDATESIGCDDEPRRYLHPEERILKTSTGPAGSKASSSSAGWSVDNAPIGFCDGSAQSRCNRQDDNACLLSGHNFYRGSLKGNRESGWLTLKLAKIREGIILARLEVTTENTSKAAKDDPKQNFEFDYSINGVKTTLTKEEFESFGVTLTTDLTVYPLMMRKDTPSESDSDKFKTVDVKIRIRAATVGTTVMRLSHIYYA